MQERRTRIPFPTPASPPVDGSEVQVAEATERWSEVTLEDGTVLRVKPNVMSAIRVDGQYDAEGNPVYAVKGSQVVMIASTPSNLRRGGSGIARSN
jgi:hypothetical protein